MDEEEGPESLRHLSLQPFLNRCEFSFFGPNLSNNTHTYTHIVVHHGLLLTQLYFTRGRCFRIASYMCSLVYICILRGKYRTIFCLTCTYYKIVIYEGFLGGLFRDQPPKFHDRVSAAVLQVACITHNKANMNVKNRSYEVNRK